MKHCHLLFFFNNRKHRKEFADRQLRLYIAVAIIVSAMWSIVQALLNAADKSRDRRGRMAIFLIVQVVYIILLILFLGVTSVRIYRMVAIVSRQTSSLNLHNKRTERRLSMALIVITKIWILCLIPRVFASANLAQHFIENDIKRDVSASEDGNSRDDGGNHNNREAENRLLRSRQIAVWCTVPLFVSCVLAPIVFMYFDSKIRSLFSRDTQTSKTFGSKPLRKISQQIPITTQNKKQQMKKGKQMKNNLSYVNSLDDYDELDNNNSVIARNTRKLADTGRTFSTDSNGAGGGGKISVERTRKISKTASFKDMTKKVSVASATMEIRNGVLVLKQDEKRVRKISKQQTVFSASVNECFDNED